MNTPESPSNATSTAVEFFHESAGDYDDKHYGPRARSFMTVRQDRVLEFVDRLALPPGSKALDAGCGPGHLVLALARRGFRMWALDGAEGMLRAARARVEAAQPAHPVDFRQGDIEKLPYGDAEFDLVLSTGVIEYLKNDTQVLREFFRVLRPGGHLILPVTNALSPVLALDFVIEPLKRQAWLLGMFNAVWTRLGRSAIRPRHFEVRRHRVSVFRASLQAAGFDVKDGVYFHLLPWPRPLDQFFPRATAYLGERMETRARSALGVAGEGYVVLCRRPDSA